MEPLIFIENDREYRVKVKTHFSPAAIIFTHQYSYHGKNEVDRPKIFL